MAINFLDLPYEVTANILSKLKPNQTFSLNILCKYFKYVFDNYKHNIYDTILEQKGFVLKDYDPKIIFKSLDLCEHRCSQLQSNPLLINNNGNVLDKNGKSIMENAISIVDDFGMIYIINSFGTVYMIKDNIIHKIDKLSNIVQVRFYMDEIYYLDINGKVFDKDHNIILFLKQIIKISNCCNKFYFIDINGTVYDKTGDKIHENVESILFFGYNKKYIVYKDKTFTYNDHPKVDISHTGKFMKTFMTSYGLHILDDNNYLYCFGSDGKYENVEDFFSNCVDTTVLYKNKKLLISAYDYNTQDFICYNDTPEILTKAKNIILLDCVHFLIDGKLYFFDINDNNFQEIIIQ